MLRKPSEEAAKASKDTAVKSKVLGNLWGRSPGTVEGFMGLAVLSQFSR